MKKLVFAFLALLGINGALRAEQKQDITTAGVQSAPGVAAAASTTIAGLPLSDILVLLSMGFVGLQVAYLIWKWRRDARREEERQNDRRRGVKAVDPCTACGGCETDS